MTKDMRGATLALVNGARSRLPGNQLAALTGSYLAEVPTADRTRAVLALCVSLANVAALALHRAEEATPGAADELMRHLVTLHEQNSATRDRKDSTGHDH